VIYLFFATPETSFLRMGRLMAGKPLRSSIAIDALAVKDIIVCGQISGGAIKAVLDPASLDTFLRPARAIEIVAASQSVI
jgi:hypothetical protein